MRVAGNRPDISPVLVGGVVAGLHAALSGAMFLWFGLGMSRSGTRFLVNYWMQPGTWLSSTLGLPGWCTWFINAAVWFLVGSVGALLFGRHFYGDDR
jgi:hypothetical protein